MPHKQKICHAAYVFLGSQGVRLFPLPLRASCPTDGARIHIGTAMMTAVAVAGAMQAAAVTLGGTIGLLATTTAVAVRGGMILIGGLRIWVGRESSAPSCGPGVDRSCGASACCTCPSAGRSCGSRHTANCCRRGPSSANRSCGYHHLHSSCFRHGLFRCMGPVQ